jgi:hypothetical protein
VKTKDFQQKSLYHDDIHLTTMPGDKFEANLRNFGKGSVRIIPRWHHARHRGMMHSYRATLVREIQAHIAYK